MKHSKESDSMMIKTEASHASLLEFIKNRSFFLVDSSLLLSH